MRRFISRFRHAHDRVQLTETNRQTHDEGQNALIWQPREPAHTMLEPVDSEWIDIERLRMWLSICEREHGDKCETVSQVVTQLSQNPEWLIDVNKGHLVPFKPNDRYVAVSYVWGAVPCMKTTQRTLPSLLMEGALFQTLDPPLPRTIKDVIKLTKLLGERYLWVDALCIIQDVDGDLKYAQLNSMAAIYNKAHLTIVAANGWDANHGLRGIKGITSPRNCSTNSTLDFWESLQPHSTIWYSRAWTLQELIFSRRIIMFHYQLAVWECQCGTWHEALNPHYLEHAQHQLACGDICRDPSIFRMRDWTEGSEFDIWPNLKHYADIVHNYSIRTLSFPQDVQAAFGGVLSTFSRTFQGGFIFGLPVMFFDVGLLWQPRHHCERRVPRTGESIEYEFPSWSWMGWVGEIDPRSWESGYDYIGKVNRLRIEPPTASTSSTISWFQRSATDGKELPIETTYQIYESHRHNNRKSRLAGWRRGNNEDLQYYSYQGHAKYSRTFYHDLVRAEFKYPIPIIPATAESAPPQQSLHLCCKTRRATFQLAATLKVELSYAGDPARISTLPRISIVKQGRVVGELRLNVPTSFTRGDPSDECELIELSAGQEGWGHKGMFGNLDVWEPASEEILTNGLPQKYSFYNVMWIKWVDGIAYREAIGRVLKDAWDEDATEWIDVVLG